MADTAIGRPGSRPFPGLRIASWVVVLTLGFFIVFPLAQALLGLLGISAATGAGSPWEVLTSGKTLRALLNTAILVVAGGAFAVVVAAGLAWVNERTDARVGWLAEILPLVSMFVPSLAAAIGWVFLLDPEIGLLNGLLRDIAGLVGVEMSRGPLDLYSWYGLIWCYGVFLVPFAYLAIVNGLRSIDPALEEAAGLSGAGPLKTLLTVTQPSLKPALGGAVMLVIVMGMALFSIPVIIGTRAGIDVLPVLIVHDVTQAYPVDEVSALSRSLILLVVVLAAGLIQRRLVGASKAASFATIGGKASRSSVIRLGRLRWPARFVMAGYVGLAAVIPFLGLVLVSVQRFWHAEVDWSSLNFGSYREMFAQPTLREGLRNSLVLAAVCATVVVVAAVLVTHLLEVRRERAAQAFDSVLKAPAAVPHIVFALALIAAFGGAPFGWNGTALILVTAYVVMYFPQAAMYATAAVQQVGRPLTEASTVSGVPDGTTLRRVLVPLMMPAMIAAWALIFVLMSGDITASAMLASTRTPVVGFVMLDQWSSGSYPTIAALGVTLTVVSTTVVLFALAVRHRLRYDR
ncbi:iron ABC transporter permease [Kribbella sp. NPDC026596]|uniref:ABC transporter permease n=1 Tax=Kribbella sp. NPDC026596 TaxID=3155122 RepID=UPI0033C972B7